MFFLSLGGETFLPVGIQSGSSSNKKPKKKKKIQRANEGRRSRGNRATPALELLRVLFNGLNFLAL